MSATDVLDDAEMTVAPAASAAFLSTTAASEGRLTVTGMLPAHECGS